MTDITISDFDANGGAPTRQRGFSFDFHRDRAFSWDMTAELVASIVEDDDTVENPSKIETPNSEMIAVSGVVASPNPTIPGSAGGSSAKTTSVSPPVPNTAQRSRKNSLVPDGDDYESMLRFGNADEPVKGDGIGRDDIVTQQAYLASIFKADEQEWQAEAAAAASRRPRLDSLDFMFGADIGGMGMLEPVGVGAPQTLPPLPSRSGRHGSSGQSSSNSSSSNNNSNSNSSNSRYGSNSSSGSGSTSGRGGEYSGGRSYLSRAASAPSTIKKNKAHTVSSTPRSAIRGYVVGLAKTLEVTPDLQASFGTSPLVLNAEGQVCIGIYTREERRQLIEKFRKKKQNRIWRKQIKYDCRKRLAETRPRVKGRFVSKKELAEGNWRLQPDGEWKDISKMSSEERAEQEALSPADLLMDDDEDDMDFRSWSMP